MGRRGPALAARLGESQGDLAEQRKPADLSERACGNLEQPARDLAQGVFRLKLDR